MNIQSVLKNAIPGPVGEPPIECALIRNSIWKADFKLLQIFISIVDTRSKQKNSKHWYTLQDDDRSHHNDDFDETHQNHRHDCPSQASLALVSAYLAESDGRPEEAHLWKA